MAERLRRSWRWALAGVCLAAGLALVWAFPARGGAAWVAVGLILAACVLVWSHVLGPDAWRT